MTSRPRRLLMEHLVVLTGIAVGLALGSDNIGDNSTLVHLTTGLGIVNTGHIPRTDPYSFTAHGNPWVVQSWIPEVFYGVFYKLAGAHGLQILNAALYAATGGLIAHLARTGSWLRTSMLAAIGICFGAAQWSPRPTAFNFLFVALLVYVVEKRRSKWWLVPLGLIWVNSHGSWPLGLAYLAAMAAGARLDKSEARPLVNYFAALFGAMLVGGLLSPPHLRIFTFPLLPFGSRAHAFQTILEWMSPNFRSDQFVSGLMILIVLMASLTILTRHKPRWADLLPVMLFLAASLTGLRNLPMLGIVLMPVLARALKTEPVFEPPANKKFYISAQAGLLGGVLGVIVLVLGVGALVVDLSRPGFELKAYPNAGVQWLTDNNLVAGDKRVYGPDWVGCYLIFEKGTQANVYLDDRYDMYPAPISRDSFHMNNVDTDLRPIFAKYNFDAFLLPRGSRLSTYLSVDADYERAWSDTDFVIFVPRSKSPL